MNGDQVEIERFYGLVRRLSQLIGGPRRLADISHRQKWSARGVYFFFEQGEMRPAREDEARVVRVGTHGLKQGSKSTLFGRLSQHRGTQSGGGNHRGSVFRRHVGNSLIKQQMIDCPTWAVGANASREVRMSERFIEEEVSRFLGNMEVLWLDVPDEPGPNSWRGYIERNAIGLVAGREPSLPGWLGNYSGNTSIVRSHLWNVNHIEQKPESGFLDVFEFQLREMAKGV